MTKKEASKDMIDLTEETKDDVFYELLEAFDAEAKNFESTKEARGLKLRENLQIASSRAKAFAKRYENAN